MSSDHFLQLPHIVKGYHIESFIGRGGIGEVYLAKQPYVDRQVAIKIINEQYAKDPAFVKNFELEARFVADLEHPFIVPLYDYWRSPDGAYLVMRWLRHGSLEDDLMQRGSWNLLEVQPWLHQIGSALAFAHERNIVHRDLKPGNILLDENKTSYLSDFGIAIKLSENPANGREVVQNFGSPFYCAPEQLTDNRISIQADIYSLAIVVYELLTGKLPFVGNDLNEVIRSKLFAPFPSLIPGQPAIPRDIAFALDQILAKATDRDPMQRHTTVAEFVQEFDQILDVSLSRTTATALPSIQVRQSSDSTDTSATVRLPDELPNVAGGIGTIKLTTELRGARNPYKGLATFEETDAGDYFGRETQVEQLTQRLQVMTANNVPRLICLVGASGSGKSSLVRAGLIPAVREGTVPGDWYVTVMTPGASPIQNLVEAINSVAIRGMPDFVERLQEAPDAFPDIVTSVIPANANLLIVVDQLEEVFTQAIANSDSDRFLDMLALAATHQNSRIHIICTLRADYYEPPLTHPAFSVALQAGTEVVLPMAHADVVRVIEAPARGANLVLEHGLSQLIANDVRSANAPLPLLQFALAGLYDKRQGNVLTIAAYQALGGVTGALANHAETVFKAFEGKQEHLTQKLFLRLVFLPLNGKPVRRRMSQLDLNEMFTHNSDGLKSALDVFSRSRLLTYDRDPQTRIPTVEIAHEALLTAWQRLAGWIDDARESLHTHQRLQSAVLDWEAANCHDSFLAVGARLAQLEQVRDNPVVTLTSQENSFLQQSLQQQNRIKRRQQQVILTLSTAVVVAILLTAVAYVQRQAAVDARVRADQEAAVARSRELSAFAQANLRDDPRLSLESSVEALNFADTYEARNALLTSIGQYLFVASYTDLGTSISAMDYDDGVWVVGQDNGQITILASDADNVTWQATDSRIQDIAVQHGYVVAADEAGSVIIWELAEPETPLYMLEHASPVWSVDFHPSEPLAVTGDDAGHVTVWDVATGGRLREWDAHDGSVFHVSFSPQGDAIASGGADQQLLLWDIETDEPVQRIYGHSNWILTAEFSPNGQVVASAGIEPAVRFWDVSNGTLILEMPLLYSGWTRDLRFDARGQFLYTATQDGDIYVWDTTTQQIALPPLSAHSATVWDIHLLEDTLYSASEDGHLITWDMTTGSRLLVDSYALPGEVLSSSFVSDGTQVAVHRRVDNGTSLTLVEVRSGRMLQDWDLGGLQLTQVLLTNDHRFVVGYGLDSQFYVWDIAEGTLAFQALLGVNDTPQPMALLPGASEVFAISQRGILIINLTTEEVVETGIDVPAYQIAASPDGERIAIGTRNGAVELWTCDGEKLATYGGHTAEITQLIFVDNNRLLSTSRDGDVRLWDIRQGSAFVFQGHTDWVFDAALSPDGTILVSGGRDQQVLMWDVAARQPLGVPMQLPDWVVDVHFDEGSETAIAVTRSGVIAQWEGNVDAWKQTASHMLD